ncbi:hypothetical protein [Liberibacter crescens]|uniref:hypothetical protein n=1 Tax=Liberibacter crescens TaxID=1273132 RepID=UPI0007632857|nr:hypothetical protein [Liberibacter crescens]AMC12929.1 hypothetical protein RL73_04570 [Liberibacter crescens]
MSNIVEHNTETMKIMSAGTSAIRTTEEHEMTRERKVSSTRKCNEALIMNRKHGKTISSSSIWMFRKQALLFIPIFLDEIIAMLEKEIKAFLQEIDDVINELNTRYQKEAA